MKLKKRNKIILIVVSIIILLLIAGVIVYFVWLKPEKKEEMPSNTTTVTNEIASYGYTLDDRDSKLFEEKYEDLKKILNEEEINKEDYAKTLAELFIIDLFTIDNKISKYDIGGLEYVHPSAETSFRSKILDSIYKTVEDNSFNTRKQDLPIVSRIEVTAIEPTTYKMDDQNLEGFKVSLAWDYEKDLGYDTAATIIMIEEENKLHIVNYKPI